MLIGLVSGTYSSIFVASMLLVSWEEGDLLNHAYVLERAAGFVAKPSKWW